MPPENDDGALFYGDAYKAKAETAAQPQGGGLLGRDLTDDPAKPAPKDDGEKFYGAMRSPEEAIAAASADPWQAAQSDETGVPEAYRLSIKDSDGNAVELDVALIEGAAPVFKKLGLSNTQANELAAHYANEVLPSAIQQHQERAVAGLVEQSKAWMSQAQADPELRGGGVEAAKSLVDRYGDDALRQFLRESTVGNHPGLVKLLARVARELARP